MRLNKTKGGQTSNAEIKPVMMTTNPVAIHNTAARARTEREHPPPSQSHPPTHCHGPSTGAAAATRSATELPLERPPEVLSAALEVLVDRSRPPPSRFLPPALALAVPAEACDRFGRLKTGIQSEHTCSRGGAPDGVTRIENST